VTGPILVVGGTGIFCRRLVRGLVATTDLDVIVAARDLRRTRLLVDEINVAQSRARAGQDRRWDTVANSA
jgi:uncharacterized protein YbjT (DUF2867 family)